MFKVWWLSAYVAAAMALAGCTSRATIVSDGINPPSPPPPAIVSLQADLNGDRKPEAIGVYESNGQMRLQVAGVASADLTGFKRPALRVENLPPAGLVLAVAEGPTVLAFQVQGKALVPVDYYQLKAPAPKGNDTYVMIDKSLNVLWLYRDGQLNRTWRVATGRDYTGPQPTWQDYKLNFVTPEGTFFISQMNDNPGYTDFKTGKFYPGGAPDHPLGNIWMGFPVLKGTGPDGRADSGGIWAIHGTNEPDSIGYYRSDGCIRLNTENARELFKVLKPGTRIEIFNSSK